MVSASVLDGGLPNSRSTVTTPAQPVKESIAVGGFVCACSEFSCLSVSFSCSFLEMTRTLSREEDAVLLMLQYLCFFYEDDYKGKMSNIKPISTVGRAFNHIVSLAVV